MTAGLLIDTASEWLAHDPDPEARRELGELIAAGSAELAERFAGPLDFGTAGLRGILGAGQSRMNRAVVRLATAGLARYLCDHEPGAQERGVVVGCDGRLMGRAFAEEAARVLCAAGFKVHLCGSLCPTPIVAFGVRELGAAAGVMVTASHNPREYNGYKVYAANGAQIIPPADRLIAGAIEAAGPADAVAVADLTEARDAGRLVIFGAALERRYLDSVRAVCPGAAEDRSFPIAYTPLHGVGAALFELAMAEAGFGAVHVVPEQAAPDGTFPTVAFPNPEEQGTLDLVLDLARRHGAPLVLANDPDADRLAAAARSEAGDYVLLSGNELGALLGHYVLSEADTALHPHGLPPGQPLVVSTIVSSPLLGFMAGRLGARYAETLTGFKWLANRALQIEAESDARFLFAFEEALGCVVGPAVRDKDGISAAVVLATLVARLRARGQTLLGQLEHIARQFGLFASRGRSIRLPGAQGQAQIQAIMAKLRAAPPAELGGQAVLALTDYLHGTRTARGHAPDRVAMPASDVVAFELAGDGRAVVRPSGTEPKIKLYLDVRESVGEDEPFTAARTRADERLRRIERDLIEAAGIAAGQ
ncbi:MAG: phospho-sugar mutase [Deltaproteobacteria bacterium]|nr:phospho-sugar mutase [Deltaproteobacteria bacterium]